MSVKVSLFILKFFVSESLNKYKNEDNNKKIANFFFFFLKSACL